MGVPIKVATPPIDAEYAIANNNGISYYNGEPTTGIQPLITFFYSLICSLYVNFNRFFFAKLVFPKIFILSYINFPICPLIERNHEIFTMECHKSGAFLFLEEKMGSKKE